MVLAQDWLSSGFSRKLAMSAGHQGEMGGHRRREQLHPGKEDESVRKSKSSENGKMYNKQKKIFRGKSIFGENVFDDDFRQKHG